MLKEVTIALADEMLVDLDILEDELDDTEE
jgi:hypothetical protein